MDCKTCKEQRNVIPYIAHEAAEARHERRERRLLIALLIAVLLLFASNAMWLYYVVLKRHPGSSRPDAIIFYDEDREVAIAEMRKYSQKNGFTIQDPDGRFTIATISLVEKEPIYGAPVLKETPWHEIFDHLGNRREGTK